jgi:hypothetical protein
MDHGCTNQITSVDGSYSSLFYSYWNHIAEEDIVANKLSSHY